MPQQPDGIGVGSAVRWTDLRGQVRRGVVTKWQPPVLAHVRTAGNPDLAVSLFDCLLQPDPEAQAAVAPQAHSTHPVNPNTQEDTHMGAQKPIEKACGCGATFKGDPKREFCDKCRKTRAAEHARDKYRRKAGWTEAEIKAGHRDGRAETTPVRKSTTPPAAPEPQAPAPLPVPQITEPQPPAPVAHGSPYMPGVDRAIAKVLRDYATRQRNVLTATEALIAALEQ